MIARGFKPVGWVAAVASAALGCYMLSLNVASERAELASLERQIVLAKRDIRGLQTELGTRGRLQQLEHWNADVLALSAPASGQFLQDELVLARYIEPQKTFEERARVRMASAEAVASQPAPAPAVERGFAPAPPPLDRPIVRHASLTLGEPTPFVPVNAKVIPPAPPKVAKASEPKPAAPRAGAPKPNPKDLTKSASLIGASLAREIVEASKAETSGGAAGR